MSDAARAGDGPSLNIGRYILHRQIARGGMATIHIARLMGDEGFTRIVAAKRLLPEFATDDEFVTMFLDEARVASKVHHRNVVPVLDVVATPDEVILVQEYVHGVPLHLLLRDARATNTHLPVRIAVSIASQVLNGLHAAHTTTDEVGMPLDIVHRDVSPHNVMIAVDGSARLLDFGIAKAAMAAHVTRENVFKGKLAYSAPEQLNGTATLQSDVYSLAVMLWEMVSGRRMHHNAGEREIAGRILTGRIPTLTETFAHERELIAAERWAEIVAVEPIVMRGLAVELADRWADAAEMEAALVAAVPPASPADVAAWAKEIGRDRLEKNEKLIAADEASWRRTASRLTPTPGEPRRSRDRIPAMEEPTDNAMTIIAEPSQLTGPRRRRTLWIAGAAAAAILVVVIVIIVAALHSDGDAPPGEQQPTPAGISPAPTAPAAMSTPPAETPSREPPPVQTPSHEPAATAAPPPTVAEPVDVRDEPTAQPPPPKRPSPPPRSVRPVQRVPAAAHPHPPPKPAQPPSKPAQPPPTVTQPPAKDCSPPYYYEGTKKVFKPECV